MLRILIADDEILERRALTKMINSSLKYVKVIGEASNGRKAIEMVDVYFPDIVLMDIKMPGVNGIEAVKAIKKIHPEIRFIMVSAFNTFEYAKEVMQLGVKEYILKPSKQQDIIDSIQRVSIEILEERKHRNEQQSLRENLEMAVSIAQKEWVSSLLLNQVQDISFDEWGRLLGVEITSGYIMVFSMQPKLKSEPTLQDVKNAHIWLATILETILLKQEFMIGPNMDGQIPVLFLCMENMEKRHFKINVQQIIEQLLLQITSQKAPFDVKIGIGSLYHQTIEINKSYFEAKSALQQLMTQPNRQFMYSQKQDSTTSVHESTVFDIEKKLLDAVHQGEVNHVLSLLDNFISKLDANQDHNISTVKKSFEELFILITRMLHDLGIKSEMPPFIQDCESIALIVEKGKAFLISVVQHVQVWRNSHAKGMLYKAKEYIETHYAQTLTLEIVADYVELSHYYFSKLFKDRFGLTFIDYLTEIRIQNAKAEMLDSTKSLKEICYSVGYKDPNYFSRVFKKQTGLSPSEFRRASTAS